MDLDSLSLVVFLLVSLSGSTGWLKAHDHTHGPTKATGSQNKENMAMKPLGRRGSWQMWGTKRERGVKVICRCENNKEQI